LTSRNPSLELSDEVSQALRDGAPVVALESTIISHGMPYPQNVEMAAGVEQVVRDLGAVPATIAVLGGRPRIGLGSADLELLATSADVVKVSVRDLPVVIARRGHGATTVAATMRLASLAGIRVFVTGGLGGVHRGGHRTLDISADLTELSTTDVAVISAGVKSILDIGLTLEALETLRVPVLAYRTNEFPAFFSRTSGHQAPTRVDTPKEIATIMATKWELGIGGGIALANPIPTADEIPAEKINSIIEHAIEDMNARGIHGKEATPFLLGRIVELTDGASLTANIALVNNNARLGAEVAAAYAMLTR
jgi:pseudouridine-5'-phosphate glycosidase